MLSLKLLSKQTISNVIGVALQKWCVYCVLILLHNSDTFLELRSLKCMNKNRLSLVLLSSLVLSSSVMADQITPGICVGYIPSMSAYESKQIADRGPASKHSGTLYLLRSREVRERGELFAQQAGQFKRLQVRDYQSDFDTDKAYAQSIAKNHIKALEGGTGEQAQITFQQYRLVDQKCEEIWVRVRRLSSASAFEALMNSIGN